MSVLDAAIIALSFGVTFAIGGAIARRQRDAAEFFTGSRSISWPLACLSLIATETSAITFVAVPAMVFFHRNATFLQMAFGYIIGRALVAWLLVPPIRRGSVTSVYEYIHTRTGPTAGALTACVFLVTRCLADGVRLYVTALPLSLATGLSIPWSIAITLAATTVYSLLGGIRGIVWIDAIQLCIYLAGAVIAIAVMAGRIPDGFGAGLDRLWDEGIFRVFDFGFNLNGYTLWAGIIGGSAFSLASHGTDHLMAQRYLMVRTDADARKVLIGSGFFVLFQFALFLFLGACLYALWPDAQLADNNAVFAKFVAEDLPSGVRGLILSAVFAAAMSTLSGTINALAASSLQDVAVALFGFSRERARSVGPARLLSLAWALALGACAFLAPADKSVVDRVLEIAAVTYGGILGIFLLSRFTRLGSPPVLCGFFLGVGFSVLLAFVELPVVGKVFWPWYVPGGALVTIAGALLAGTRLPRRGAADRPPERDGGPLPGADPAPHNESNEVST